MADSHEYSDHAPTHHVTSLPVYFGIFGALMILTIITVAISRVDLGLLNTPIALSIAVVKATLVILFFMHVKYSTKLTWAVVIGSIFWLALVVLILLDSVVLGFRLRRGLARSMPDASHRGAMTYALMRSMQIRRFRLPPPRIKGWSFRGR